jgi:hypothetical protein
MSSTGGRLRACGACLVAAALLLTPASGWAAAPPEWHGINATSIYRDALIQERVKRQRGRPIAPAENALAGLGVKQARVDAIWALSEVSGPGPFEEPDALDIVASGLSQRGMRWSPVIVYTPWWAGPHPNGPPSRVEDFTAFAAKFARRFGRGGSYWPTSPEDPKSLYPVLPVTRYEIWNEPNFAYFWRPRPDADAYGRLFVAAATSIREVDPQAELIVGGLFPSGAGEFVAALQAAVPGALAVADGVALHPYGAGPEQVLQHVRRVRQALRAAGHPEMGLFLNEVGWPTIGTGRLGLSPVPDEVRAGNLTLVADALLRSDCGVRSFEPFTFASLENDQADDETFLGIWSPEAGYSRTALAYRELIERQLAAPRARRLPLCSEDQRPASSPLELALIRSPSARPLATCFEGSVRYDGRPLSSVRVIVQRRAAGRSRVWRRVGRTRTDAGGNVRACRTRAAGEQRVVAEIPRVAVSAPKLLSRR